VGGKSPVPPENIFNPAKQLQKASDCLKKSKMMLQEKKTWLHQFNMTIELINSLVTSCNTILKKGRSFFKADHLPI